ncbi:hypothetical protein BE17_27350 [Sorangium cellulosum]|uniref:Uncharacterized protein n=1 Tax=Sorangium cellulosum TaxID=56 RepID=A0A150SFP1_SORCE|nr:hypothetical protein BE17_27350 [Sorangium cellulosum]
MSDAADGPSAAPLVDVPTAPEVTLLDVVRGVPDGPSRILGLQGLMQLGRLSAYTLALRTEFAPEDAYGPLSTRRPRDGHYLVRALPRPSERQSHATDEVADLTRAAEHAAHLIGVPLANPVIITAAGRISSVFRR